MRIILIDENIETFEVLKEVASLSGSEVVYFNDIEEAKNFLTENKDIDAVITEKYVKNRSGGEIISFIKSANLVVPVILLTENVDKDEEEYFRSLGFSEIVKKPFNPLELLSIIVEKLKEDKGEEYIKENLHSKEEDRSSLKAVINKIINLLKKLFGK